MRYIRFPCDLQVLFETPFDVAYYGREKTGAALTASGHLQTS